jgi:hypothetical protein
MSCCQDLNINRYLIFCVSLLFFLRLSPRHLRGSCHVPPPEGAGLFDKEPNGVPRIHGRPRPKRTGPCEGRGDIVRAQLAPAPCIVADARGPPWYQQARPQAKEPRKLASGRMSRGTNPDSALHSDMSTGLYRHTRGHGMVISHHYRLFCAICIMHLPETISLALCPHNANKFVLVASCFVWLCG